jgi:hypothetical protein
MEPRAPGYNEFRCVFVLTSRSLKAIIGVSLQTRGCDCSFILTVPVQTLVGKVFVVERESGSAERFQAAGVFSALSRAAVALTAGL